VIGTDIRDSVFRDTRTFYRTSPPESVAEGVMGFVRRQAGPEVLDLGCGTGLYCLELARLGHTVQGVDVNPEYVEIARRRGIQATLVRSTLPFPDRAFDTVIVLEVLEHLEEPRALLSEAARVARGKVLFTTPNCGDTGALREQGLLFEHFADMDHRNFFTADSLTTLLEPFFRNVTVRQGDPLNPFALARSGLLRRSGAALLRLGLLRPAYRFRLYAVAEV
jgi:2-polyprenyl-3-methyl-5-hydroxy-6-metoxy-1,4-benzoquinol methylase